MNQPQKVNEKLELNLVFINHSTCFPDPRIKNTAEAFGLSEEEATKDIVSLGAFKVFPKEVWESVFPDYKDSPIAHLQRIRSQLQRYIDNNTYPYIANAARALPITKLVSFMEVIDGLERKFSAEKERYIDNLEKLLDESEKFWLKHGPKIFQTKPDELADLIRSRFDSRDAFRKKFKIEVIPLRITSLESGACQVQDLEQAKQIQNARERLVKMSEDSLDAKRDQFQMDIVLDLRQRSMDATQDFLNRIIAGNRAKMAVNSLLKANKSFAELNLMEDEALSELINDQNAFLNKLTPEDIKNPEKKTVLKKAAEGWKERLTVIKNSNPEEVVIKFMNGEYHPDSIKQESTIGVQQELVDTPSSSDPITEDLINQAIGVLRETHRCSTSAFQRRLSIGFTRAGALMDALEERGIVGPPRGAEPREILIALDPGEQVPVVEEDEEDPF